MKADIRLYYIFDAVIRAGSVSAAAEQLFITQPSVSQSIARLESQLGAKLLVRTSRGVRLSAEGEAFYPYIKQALTLINSGEAMLSGMKELKSGSIRIGASDTLCSNYLVERLERYHKLYPEIVIQTTNRTSEGTLGLLRRGELDVGFISAASDADDLNIIPIMDIHDTFVAGSRFAHLRGQSLGLGDLADLPLMMLENSARARRHVDAAAARLGVQLRPQVELCSYDLLLQFAGMNLGIACVVREFVQHRLGDDLFELTARDEIPPRSIALVTVKHIPLSLAAEKFVDMIVNHG